MTPHPTPHDESRPTDHPSIAYRVGFWLIDRLPSVVLLMALDLVTLTAEWWHRPNQDAKS